MISTSNHNVLIEYKGPFDIDILASMGSYIKHMFNNYPETCNRLYKLFFELCQNVAKYSADCRPYNSHKYSGFGSFRIEEIDNTIILTTSNLIRNEDGPTLEKYCKEINLLDKEALKHYKSVKRKQPATSRDTGAHIGIIQIGLITLNQLEVNINKVDQDHSVFTICTKLTKEN